MTLEKTSDGKCPDCGGETTFGFGLAGGGDAEGNPGIYWLCLDCDWQEPKPRKTVCFPHGLVKEDPYS